MIACPDLGTLEQSPLPASIRDHVEACTGCRLVIDVFACLDGAVSYEDCDRFDPLLAARMDGTINAAGENLLARHIASCPACRAVAETLSPARDVSGDLDQLPVVDPAGYALGLEIARGGMGRILAARDLRVGRDVAIKELFDRSRRLAARFEREGRVTARLQHPGIIPIYELGRWPDGTPFYSMRWVEGRTLREAVHDAPTLAARVALLPAVIAAAEAVAFAHGKRIIHRDLTPSNVLVGAYGETVVIDWGLAKDLSDDGDVVPASEPVDDSGDNLTNAGAVIGTAAYMPPEQAHGEHVDERADVYALGAILYHVLAGKPPYSAPTAREVVHQVRTGPPTPVEQVTALVPRDLVSIVTKAMSRDPDARYPSARELADELVRFQTGQMVTSHAYSRGERVVRFVRRHRAPVVITALAAFLIVMLGAISLWRIVKKSEEARNRVVDLLVEQGRAELVAGRSLRALAFLDAAAKAGRPQGDAFDFLLQSALAELANAPAAIDCGGDPRWLDFRPAPGSGDVVIACHDAALIWPLGGAAPRVMLPHLPGAYDAVKYSHSGARFVTWGEDGKARLWDSETGTLVGALDHGAPLTVTSFTGDDARIATTGRDGRAKIWDAATRAELRTIIVSTELLHDVYGVLGANNDRLFTATLTGSAAGWDITTGNLIREYSVAHGLVFGGELSHDGRLATTCGTDGTAKVWDTATGKQVLAVGGHTDMLWKCLFDPAGEHLLTTSQDGRANVWDIATGAMIVSVVHGDIVFEARFSADGRRFLTVGVDGRVRVWDASSGALLETHATGGGKAAGFSPDGRYLVTLRGDGRFHVWRRPEVPMLATFAPPTDASVAAVTRDGKLIAVERADGSIEVFDTVSSRLLADHLARPIAACDGSIAAMADATIRFVGQPHPQLDAAAAAWIALSPDCARVAIGHADGTFELHDPFGIRTNLRGTNALVDDAGRIATWEHGERPRVGDVAVGDTGDRPIGFSADGHRIVLVSDADGPVHEIRVWRVDGVDTGLRWSDVGITPMLDPSGTYVVVIGADHVVTIANVITGTTSSFLSQDLENASANTRGTLLAAIGEHGTAAMVLSADGRVLAQWPIAHPQPLVSQVGVTPPWAHAWWSAEGAAVSLSRNVTVRTRPHNTVPVADLMKAVPWRLVEGRLEPVKTSLRGHVVRNGPAVRDARVTVELRRSAYVGSSTISHATMETHSEPIPVHAGRDGGFEANGVYPGLYIVTAAAGDVTWQCTVPVDPDGADVTVDLSGSCRTR